MARRRPTPDPPIRVYLCDDAPGLRALLRAFLEAEADIEIAGEAEDGDGLAAAVGEAHADVVVLDLAMPRVDGLEALAQLRAADPAVGIVVLSGFAPSRMEARALALGADRYLGKDAGMEAVRATVRAVARARRGPDRALDLHDDVVQGLTAIHWALEAGAHEQAKEAARATLARAQAIIGELVAGDPAGPLRRDAPAAQRP